MASVLFCSRSSGYRLVRAYRAGALPFDDGSERARQQRRLRLLTASLKRSVQALLQTPPRAVGWGRTRGSGATLAVEVQVRRGSAVAAETMRHGLHELGWEWKRAKLTATDHDPERGAKVARIRVAVEQRRAGMALFVAEELDMNLLPPVGYQGLPQGEQVAVLTPGTNAKRYLAGALAITTGTSTPGVWYRKQTGLLLELLETLERTHPAPLFLQLTVVVDNAKLHKATEVQHWVAAHPRFALWYLPPYWPDANPIARAFGDVPDQWTRNPTRTRSWHLVGDVKQHLRANGPWRSVLSELYDTPAVTAAVTVLKTADSSLAARSQLAA